MKQKRQMRPIFALHSDLLKYIQKELKIKKKNNSLVDLEFFSRLDRLL